MANLDTRAKRASAVQLLIASVLAPPLPDGTIAAEDRLHVAHLYSGISVAVTANPSDLDSDTTYTAYVRIADGATVRAPRLHLTHSADSMLNVDLANSDRMAADRYIARSLRTGRGRTLGQTHRIGIACDRAGEAFAVKALLIDYDVVEVADELQAADTTSRTRTVDAATVAVPTTLVWHAADSTLNSALRVSASDQDRYRTTHWPGSTMVSGNCQRLGVDSDGRAGSALAVAAIIIDYAVISSGDFVPKVAET